MSQPPDPELDEHDRQCSWALELELHLKEFQPELYRGLKKERHVKHYCQKQAAPVH